MTVHDLRIATQHGVPRSTARGWLALAQTAVVSLYVVNLTEPELRQEVLGLRRRVGKRAVLPRLTLALLHASRPDEMWHIDTTVIRLLDGTRAYLHAVIDNVSRRILAWHVADRFAPVSSVAVLLEADQHATHAGSVPVVLADAGVENVNAQVDALMIATASCTGCWRSPS
ncbi:DDE-type integrase/transposase/recombinase [Luteitalea pratensis]|nr:DDE-type integrase/transposase/recombinase [Luteitalea pratensis]